jgi:hypothetical protein
LLCPGLGDWAHSPAHDRAQEDRLNSTPLIEINESHQVSATIQLDSEIAALIDQYATFIHASADDIVDKALSYVFSKDRDFQEYLKTAQSRDVVPILRVRRSGNGESPEPSANVSRSVTGWRCVMGCAVNPFRRHNSCHVEA